MRLLRSALAGPVASWRRARDRRDLVTGRTRMPAPAAGPAVPGSAVPADHFANPVAEGADPFVTRDGATYLWCRSDGDRGVALARSDRLTAVGAWHTVWRAPRTGPCSAQVWAPELHRLDGRWYVYLTGSDGRNEQHRTFVLAADTEDPFGSYTLHGPLATGDAGGPPRWSIDATVLEHRGTRSMIWSGWPGATETAQHLYLAPMSSPTTLDGPRVLISSSTDHPWERVRGLGAVPTSIDEGPQVVRHDGRTFLLFSAGSALTSAYRMGVLELVGDDPAVPSSWRKHPRPILSPTAAAPGVGHGVVVDTPDGEPWLVFHAKIGDDVSFRRAVHVQPLSWDADGLPAPGAPAPAGRTLREPGGRSAVPSTSPRLWDFAAGDGPCDLDVYAHPQLVALRDGLVLGEVPRGTVNAYRCGEKVVLRDGRYDDLEVRVRLVLRRRTGAAGVLVRTTGAALGHAAQAGYFLGLDASRGDLVVERHDRGVVVELGRSAAGRLPRRPVELVVSARGSRLSVAVASPGGARGTAGEDGRPAPLVVDDRTYAAGSVGLRCDDAAARFERWEIVPGRPPAEA